MANKYFYKKTKSLKTLSNRNVRNDEPKVNMFEVDSNSFRLVHFAPLVSFTIHFDEWWLESGANTHITFNWSWFSTYRESCGGSVTLGDDSTTQVKGKGRLELRMTFERNS